MRHDSSLGRVQRVRREIKQREVSVKSVEQTASGFAKITFTGSALADFESDSFDDHIKFIFNNQRGELIRRDYTPRAFDRSKQELVIEFALHGEGEAASWARTAQIGQSAVIGGPKGSMIIPLDYAWHLLIGDETALPAISRRLEELPAGAKVITLVSLNNPDQRPAFATQATLDSHWVDQPEALLSSLRALSFPAGEGFVWFAGESVLAGEIRQVLFAEKNFPRTSTKVSAYWKHGVADFHEPKENRG